MDLNFDHQMSLCKSQCLYSNNCLHFLKRAVPLGFNLSNGVTDTLESSSMLIYSELHMGLYTQRMPLDAVLIKW